MARILAYLRPYHFEMMQMRLKGCPYREIAEAFNKSESIIKQYFTADDIFSSTYKELEEQEKYRVQAKFESNLNFVTDELLTIIQTTKDEKTKLNAIKEWLDRGMGRSTQKSEVKLDGTIQNEHTIDDKLLEDKEAVEALKLLFEKNRGE